MSDAFRHPIILFLVLFFVLMASVFGGVRLNRGKTLEESERQNLGIVLGATLTLLALLIGFCFSMASGRYDYRKNLEEGEANAIGTEYVRALMLPSASAAHTRALLRQYTDLRVEWYTTRDSQRLEEIDAATARVQNDLWLEAQEASALRPNPIMALFASGMNDVLNSQGYTQAAWSNRIPTTSWMLLIAVAIVCSALFGFVVRPADGKVRFAFLIPLVVAVALFLIADLDSPRGGFIRVAPNNLATLKPSLTP